MQSSRELSIIIVNYRSGQHLKKCLASLFNNLKDIDFEIIVVNNDENENVETHCNASLQEAGNIKIINHKKNVGFGAACNIGAKLAQGNILWFLNPDTEIASAGINEVLKEFKKNKAVGIIGSKMIDEKNKIQEWTAGKEATILGIILNNLGYKRDKKIWESKRTVECAWVTGGAMFIRRELFEKIKGFDPNFFMYFEDIDLCKRVRMIGKKVLHLPEVEIKHIGSGSAKNKDEQKKIYYKSQEYYFEKHHGGLSKKLVKGLRKAARKG
ncbi:MAG TPA: hypothetical protein DIT25_01810 [Candidatus Moranbacteria bacterium]|nr:hypothetical protein [Candidatus Moranbacteria bacterium]